MASLHLSLGPEPSQLGAMADAIEGFGEQQGITPVTALRLTTALDEILTNVMSYGSLPEGSTIEIDIDHDEDGVTTVVEDRGPAFDPLAVASPPDLQGSIEERRIGGLGLHIVRGLVDEIGYARTKDGRNRLTLKMHA
jgi:anti-sigma regulatory factor (Ser/Thr protein kinase)